MRDIAYRELQACLCVLDNVVFGEELAHHPSRASSRAHLPCPYRLDRERTLLAELTGGRDIP